MSPLASFSICNVPASRPVILGCPFPIILRGSFGSSICDSLFPEFSVFHSLCSNCVGTNLPVVMWKRWYFWGLTCLKTSLFFSLLGGYCAHTFVSLRILKALLHFLSLPILLLRCLTPFWLLKAWWDSPQTAYILNIHNIYCSGDSADPSNLETCVLHFREISLPHVFIHFLCSFLHSLFLELLSFGQWYHWSDFQDLFIFPASHFIFPFFKIQV